MLQKDLNTVQVIFYLHMYIECYNFCTDCVTTPTFCSECVVHPGIVLNVNDCHCKSEDGYYVRYNPGTQEDECLPCHNMCKRCHGSSFYECDECRTNIAHIDILRGTTCNCIESYYYDATKTLPSDYCQRCHEFCLECLGVSTNCQRCIDNNGISSDGSSCKCNVPGYFVYWNTTISEQQCVECHPLCSKCDGPFNTQCDICDTSIGAVFLSPRTCVCSNHYYYSAQEQKCTVCSSLCGNCFGGTPDKCYNCNPSVAYSVEGASSLCVEDCLALDGYYQLGLECKSIVVRIILF